MIYLYVYKSRNITIFYNDSNEYYEDIFIPTNTMLYKTNSIIIDKENIIGIQIISGEYFIENNRLNDYIIFYNK